MQRSSELRTLPPSALQGLAQILEETESWKVLMSSIKKENDPQSYKYSTSNIRSVEDHAKKKEKLSAVILFDEWGTSGRNRPTLGTLLELLVNLELNRAADFLAVNILGEAPQRKPLSPPPSPEFSREVNMGPPIQVAYAELNDACNSSTEIGRGAFGRVFSVTIAQRWPTPVAVKQLQNDAVNMDTQFVTELNALSRYRHANLVQLLGFSYDGPCYCLIYELLSNGSLQERLALEDQPHWNTHITEPLDWKIRLNIMKDVAQALVYLHNSEQPLIHRDVKSANILLAHDWTAKLGDFGLARLIGEHNSSSSTSTIIGTSAYMAPETIMGELTHLADSFSYGVVLYEILTSLPPLDDARDCSDLISHVQSLCEEGFIFPPLLDLRAGEWGGNTHPVAHKVYHIATACVDDKDARPSMQQVLARLNLLD